MIGPSQADIAVQCSSFSIMAAGSSSAPEMEDGNDQQSSMGCNAMDESECDGCRQVQNQCLSNAT